MERAEITQPEATRPAAVSQDSMRTPPFSCETPPSTEPHQTAQEEFLPRKKLYSQNFTSPIKPSTASSDSEAAKKAKATNNVATNDSASCLLKQTEDTPMDDVNLPDDEKCLEKFRKAALWRQLLLLKERLSMKLREHESLKEKFEELEQKTEQVRPMMELLNTELGQVVGKLGLDNAAATAEDASKEGNEAQSIGVSVLVQRILDNLSKFLASEKAQLPTFSSDALLLKEQMVEAKTRNLLLEKRIRQLDEEKEDLEESLDEHKKRIIKLKSMQQQNESMAAKLPELQESVKPEPPATADLSMPLEQANVEISALRKDVEALEGSLAAKRVELEQLVAQNDELEHQIGKMKLRLLPQDYSQNLEYYDLYRKAGEEVAMLKGQVDRLVKDNEIFLDRLREDAALSSDREASLRQGFEAEMYRLSSQLHSTTSKMGSLEDALQISNVKNENLEMLNRNVLCELDDLKSTLALLTKVTAKGGPEDLDLLEEIETIAKSYDQVTQRNTSLMKQLATKEEIFVKLLSEKKALESKAHSGAAASNPVDMRNCTDPYVAKVEGNHKASLERLYLLEKESSRMKNEVDYHKRKCYELREIISADQNAKLKDLSGKYESVNAELKQKSKRSVMLETDNKRLEEELSRAKKKLALYAFNPVSGAMANATSLVKDLEEQVNAYKSLLKCNTCNVKDKDTVLTKCMHVFCKDCIDKRVETRQRKCPNCGEPFSQSEVKTIYI